MVRLLEPNVKRKYAHFLRLVRHMWADGLGVPLAKASGRAIRYTPRCGVPLLSLTRELPT